MIFRLSARQDTVPHVIFKTRTTYGLILAVPQPGSALPNFRGLSAVSISQPRRQLPRPWGHKRTLLFVSWVDVFLKVI